MSEPVWRMARKRALAETLELIRLNDPWKALLTLGLPIAVIAASWFLFRQLAVATVVTVSALAILSFVIFLSKWFVALIRIPEEQRRAFATSLEETRCNFVRTKNELERVKAPIRQPDNYYQAIFQNGAAVASVPEPPTTNGNKMKFPVIVEPRFDRDKVFRFAEQLLLLRHIEEQGIEATEQGAKFILRGVEAQVIGNVKTVIGERNRIAPA